MSIYDLLDDLSKNADSVSRDLHKKRCSLARETDRDSFAQGTIEFSHLEALLKGIEAALAEIKKHIGTDTILPTSAIWSEDTQSKPTTVAITETVILPKWCKKGQWVFYNGCLLARIEGFEKVDKYGSTPPTTYVLLESYDTDTTHGEPFPRLPKQIKPVKFRPYTFEEAKGLLGKTMETSCDDAIEAELISKVYRDAPSEEVTINGSRFDWLVKECDATIDGVPIGVPEVDVAAMEEK